MTPVLLTGNDLSLVQLAAVSNGAPVAFSESAIAAMQANTATVLELAATAHWLAVYEKKEDWEQELRKRKGVKLDNGREKQALELLKSLKLRPAV